MIYRTFFKNNSNIINIPKSLTVSLNNSILNDVKESYLFIDPTTYSSEITREFLYQNTSFLQYTFIKDFLQLFNKLTVNSNINFS
tara:strand:- start:360 stop:614 length:255 start_codon:yes stop_codon:yes gene_type:complete